MKRTLVEANIPEWRKKASRTKSGLPGKHRLREKRLLTASACFSRYTLYDVETQFFTSERMHNAAAIVKTCKKKRRTTHRAAMGRESVFVGCFVAHFRPSLVFSLSARCAHLFLMERGRGSRRRAKSFVSVCRRDVRNSQNRSAVSKVGEWDWFAFAEPVFASARRGKKRPLICTQNANWGFN